MAAAAPEPAQGVQGLPIITAALQHKQGWTGKRLPRNASTAPLPSPAGAQPRLEFLLLLFTVSPEPIPGKWDLSEGTNLPAHVSRAVTHPA